MVAGVAVEAQAWLAGSKRAHNKWRRQGSLMTTEEFCGRFRALQRSPLPLQSVPLLADLLALLLLSPVSYAQIRRQPQRSFFIAPLHLANRLVFIFLLSC